MREKESELDCVSRGELAKVHMKFDEEGTRKIRKDFLFDVLNVHRGDNHELITQKVKVFIG